MFSFRSLGIIEKRLPLQHINIELTCQKEHCDKPGVSEVSSSNFPRNPLGDIGRTSDNLRHPRPCLRNPHGGQPPGPHEQLGYGQAVDP